MLKAKRGVTQRGVTQLALLDALRQQAPDCPLALGNIPPRATATNTPGLPPAADAAELPPAEADDSSDDSSDTDDSSSGNDSRSDANTKKTDAESQKSDADSEKMVQVPAKRLRVLEQLERTYEETEDALAKTDAECESLRKENVELCAMVTQLKDALWGALSDGQGQWREGPLVLKKAIQAQG